MNPRQKKTFKLRGFCRTALFHTNNKKHCCKQLRLALQDGVPGDFRSSLSASLPSAQKPRAGQVGLHQGGHAADETDIAMDFGLRKTKLRESEARQLREITPNLCLRKVEVLESLQLRDITHNPRLRKEKDLKCRCDSFSTLPMTCVCARLRYWRFFSFNSSAISPVT